MKNLFKYKSKCCNEPIARCQDWYYCTNCLSFVKGLVFHYPLIIGFIILIILSLCSFTAKAPNKYYKFKVDTTDVILEKQAIIKYMQEIDILFPEIVYRQIEVESNHFKSPITYENKNLLGIKYIKQDLAKGEHRNHAVFNSYKDCLKDYKRLQQYYLGNLANKYATDPEYTNLIRNGQN